MQYTQTQVKERPILFSGEMVRAILDGRKTQTRRVLKAPVMDDIPYEPLEIQLQDGAAIVRATSYERGLTPGAIGGFRLQCPYGKPGDRLYVRETWGISHHGGATIKGTPHDPYVLYRATNSEPTGDELENQWEPFKWRPSIHMPRWASRILLEITDVRVERLQDISEEDARAEGYESREDFLYGEWARGIIEKYGNAWVWAITLQRIG